jgi:hypothetical protein
MADATAQRTRRVTATDLAKLAGFIQAAVSLWIIGKQVGRLTLEWQKLIVYDRRRTCYVPNRIVQKRPVAQDARGRGLL